MARIDFCCLDCNVDTLNNDELYQLYDRVWLQAHNSLSGFLCIGCIENRLGRMLVPADFPPVELNENSIKYPKSLRLLSRMI